MLPGETIGEILLNILKIYLILSFLLTCYSVIRMYVIRHRATAVKYGKERIQKLIEQGRFRQLPLYTMDEISQKKSLGEVRLSIFPNDTGERRKYVIVCPGGGYAHCVTGQEGYPIAAKLNEMGYTAFVLEYRTGFHCGSYTPMQDLARAVKSIEEHHEELNVDPEDYADSGLSLDQCEPLAGSSLLEYLEGTDRNLALRAWTPLYVRSLRQQKNQKFPLRAELYHTGLPAYLYDGRQQRSLSSGQPPRGGAEAGAETGRRAACL